jgi:thiamine biosynthesis lipoprotein
MQLFRYPFKVMGSPCELQLYASAQSQADAAAALAQRELLRLETAYSRFRDDSLATRINRSAGSAQGIEVDAETAGLLDYAQQAWQQSDGLFDITSGVLRQVWDFKSQRLPAQAQIDAMLPRIGWQRLRWERPRLWLPRGMELDFGGYVKEYAADSAARVCREAGIRHGLVELGGDIALVGPHPDGRPWEVGIRNPRAPEKAIARIPLAQGAIASSGDYERYMNIGGHRYCHILNPKTGWPVQGLAGVSVVAEQCLIAGTASTVAMLKGEVEGPDWLAELGLTWLCIRPDGSLRGTAIHPGST